MTQLNKTFNYYPVLFGSWAKKAIKLSFEQFDKLKYEDLQKDENGLNQFNNTFNDTLIKGFKSFGINEVISADDGYFHLMFDVDEVKTTEQYSEMLIYFNGLTERFGNYAIAGYSNDEEFARFAGVKYIEGTPKIFSAHVVFYETKASVDTLAYIFKMKGQDYVNDNIKYQDMSIWKDIIGGNSETHKHLMRTVISNKLMVKCLGKDENGNFKNEYIETQTAGNVIDSHGKELPNSCSLITVKGDEREITIEDCEVVGIKPKEQFDDETEGNLRDYPNEDLDEMINMMKQNDNKSKSNSEVVNVYDENDVMITMTYDKLSRILYKIHTKDLDTNFDLLKKVCGNLSHAAHVFNDRNKLAQVITDWYNDHDEWKHAEEVAAFNFINQYYNPNEQPSNKWYYSLLKLIDDKESKKEVIKNNEVDKGIRKSIINAEKVNDEDYDFEAFQRDSFNDIDSLIYKFSLVVFLNLKNGDVIVKFKNEYLVMSKSDFRAKYNYTYSFKHKGKKLTVSLSNIINENKYNHLLKKYSDVSLMSNKSNVLSLWTPPMKTTYNKDLIVKFIDYYKNHVIHAEPMVDFFDSLAYKLRHPNAIISKVFINIGRGHDGKSLLMSSIDAIFNKYSMITQRDAITADKFNSWQDSVLYLGIEELQSDNNNKDSIGENKILEKFIKLLTTPTTSRRGMHKELTKGTNNFMISINSNDPFIDGLAFTKCEAVIDRLVIAEFINDDNKNAIDELADETLKNDKRDEFIYSLYYYLYNDYIISENYSTERYYGNEKYEYLNNVKRSVNTHITKWIKEYVSTCATHSFKGISYRYFYESAANEAFNEYCRKNRISRNDWLNNIISLNVGFERVITHIEGASVRIVRITQKDFDDWVNDKVEDIDEAGFADNDEVEHNKEFDDWIEKNEIKNDKFNYILGNVIEQHENKKELKDYLLNLGYTYSKHIKVNNKQVRGYKYLTQ